MYLEFPVHLIFDVDGVATLDDEGEKGKRAHEGFHQNCSDGTLFIRPYLRRSE